MGDDNAFIHIAESAPGRIRIVLQESNLPENGSIYGKVLRDRCKTENIVDMVAKKIPLVDTGTIVSVLNAYADSVLEALSRGRSVPFGRLGTFYISAKGAVERDSGKIPLTIKFEAAQLMTEAVGNMEIISAKKSEPHAFISSVINVATGVSGGSLTEGCSVLIKGSNLCIGGKDSGVWFVPSIENGSFSHDEASWIKIDSPLVYNQPSKLLFNLPQSVKAGTYRIVVHTRYLGRRKYERKEIIEIISDKVTVS